MAGVAGAARAQRRMAHGGEPAGGSDLSAQIDRHRYSAAAASNRLCLI